MRNRYPGPCYRCGERVEAGEGYFERVPGKGWRVQHKPCALKYRGTAVGNSQPQQARAQEAPDAQP